MLHSSAQINRDRAAAATAPLFSAATLAAVLGLGLVLALAKPVAAYDDDVDVVCFEYEVGGKSETECQTIGELTAECALTDPEYTSDVCQGLLENRRPVGGDLTTKKKPSRKVVGSNPNG